MRRGVPPQAQRAVLSQAAADTSESATKALQLERVAQELAARAQTLADRETALYIREVGSQRGGGGGRVCKAARRYRLVWPLQPGADVLVRLGCCAAARPYACVAALQSHPGMHTRTPLAPRERTERH